MTRRARSLAFAAVLAFALLLHLPSVRVPLALDDLVQHAMLHGSYPVRRAPWSLYEFIRDDPAEHAALRRAGMLPWWHDPHFRLTMLRPLASLLRAADHHAIGDAPAPLHLVSLAWFALTLVLAWRLFRRLLDERVALLAVALLGVSARFVIPIGWVANRCALVAFSLGLAAALAYLRWRDAPGRPAAALTLGLAAAALLSAEYALGVLAVIPALSLVDRRARRATLAASAALVAAYLALRLATRAGIHGSTLYADPFADPLVYAAQAPGRFLSLVFAAVTGADADLRPPGLPAPALLACVASPLAWALAAWRGAPDTRRAVAVLATAATLALATVTGSSWGASRLVATAALWLAPLVALLGAEALAAARARRPIALALAPAAVGLLYAHGPNAVAATANGYVVLATQYGASAEDALLLAPRDAPLADAHLVVLNAADPQTLYFARATRLAAGYAVPTAWTVLSSTNARVAFERVDANTFELSCATGLLRSFGARWFTPSAARTAVGARASLDGAEVEVREAGPQGPTRIRVRLEVSLEDRGWWIAARLNRRLARLGLPAPGAVLSVPAP